MNLAQDGRQLRPEDLKIHCFKVDWGCDESYPLDNMTFFKLNKSSHAELCQIPRYETTQYRPKQNFEYRVRVFVKDSSKEALAKSAFARYSKKHGGLRNLPAGQDAFVTTSAANNETSSPLEREIQIR